MSLLLVQKCLTVFTIRAFDSSSKSSLRHKQRRFDSPFGRLLMLAVPGHQHASLQTHWASAELNEAHRLSLLYHRAFFTSPLPPLVPKQQPLLVYLCVFALWFSSEQHNPSPSGDWLSGLVIQRSTEKTMYTVLSLMDDMFHPENRLDLEIFFSPPTYDYYISLTRLNSNSM